MSRRSTPLAVLACALAAWLAHPRPALAESDVLVVGGGPAERAQLPVVRSAIENALRKAGWTWPARLPSAREADSLLKCDDSRSPWTCIPATISGLRASDVQRVFVMSVESRPSPAPMVVLTARIIVASSPPSFVVRQRFCEQCSAGQLVQASEELTRDLFSELAARAAATAIDVTSDPSDAEVRLDGSLVGKTHARVVTTAGKHLISVTRPDFVSEVRTVRVEQGQTTALVVTLRAASPGPASSGAASPVAPATEIADRRSSRALPTVAIAAGTGLAVFGGVALYLGQLGGPSDRYRYTRATPVGIASIVLGAGAIGAGIYLWRNADGSGLSGAVDTHRSFVVWTGRF